MVVGPFLASLNRADGRPGLDGVTAAMYEHNGAAPSHVLPSEELVASGLVDPEYTSMPPRHQPPPKQQPPKMSEREWRYREGTSVRVLEPSPAPMAADTAETNPEVLQLEQPAEESIYSPDVLAKCSRYANAAGNTAIRTTDEPHAASTSSTSPPPVYGVAPADPSNYGAPIVPSPGLGWNPPRFQHHIHSGSTRVSSYQSPRLRASRPISELCRPISLLD